MGGVVPLTNVPDVSKGKVKLTPDLLADIYLGKITKWNDRKIMAVNQELRLPDLDITVVHRADGSGTTWIFTNYLSKTSPEWKDKMGFGKTVSWPIGVGGKGNEGVAGLVKKPKDPLDMSSSPTRFGRMRTFSFRTEQANSFCPQYSLFRQQPPMLTGKIRRLSISC